MGSVVRRPDRAVSGGSGEHKSQTVVCGQGAEGLSDSKPGEKRRCYHRRPVTENDASHPVQQRCRYKHEDKARQPYGS